MSDTSIQESQTDTSLSPIELMGGNFAVALLAILFLGALLIDTMFLNSWVGLRSSDLVFRDPFTGDFTGASGGFSLALVAVLAVGLLGLHLFSRTSFAFSAFIALVFVFIQFLINYNNSSLDSFLSETMTGYQFWPSPLGCGELTLRDQVFARYQAVDPATSAGGIQKDFTVMLQFNVFVGALIAGLIWIVGGLTWIIRGIMRLVRGSHSVAQRRHINSTWLGVPERTILFQTAFLTLIAAIAAPMIAILSNRPDAVTATIREVIWVAALLFLLDLARWALMTASDAIKTVMHAENDTTARELFLQPVVDQLRRDFSREIKGIVEMPADETTTSPADMALPTLQRGEGLIIEETLGRRHFDLIAKTVNEQILDHGHTVLIICPEEHLDRTEEIFYDLLGSGKDPGSRPRIWRVGQNAKRLDGAVDVLLTSQFSLEALASNVKNYEKELKLLGGTVALNLHETDFGLLDVALDRLRPSIPVADNLVGIFHSEPRKDMSTRVENFATMPNNNSRAATTTRFERGIQQWTMVLDCNATSLLDKKADLPVGYRALISIASQERRANPFIYGASVTYADLNWENMASRLLINEDNELLRDLSKVTHTSILPEQREHSVAIVDDKGNLADAIAVTSSTPHALESLKIVTLGSYPMARYLATEFQTALRKAPTSKNKRDALKEFKDQFGSIAGKPRQGPRELATKLRMTFRAEANAAAARNILAPASGILKLSQNRIAAFLDRPSRALKQLRVNTSRGGLQRLFRSAFRLRDDEQVVSVRAADDNQSTGGSGRLRIKNFVLSGPPAADDEAIPVLSIHGVADHHLPVADHGLSYAEGTRFWAGDNFLTVDQVDLNNRIVHCTTRNADAVHPYHFVRDYALQLTDTGRSSFAVEEFFEESSSRQPFELVTGYVDCAARTYQAYAYGTMRFPFGKGNIRPTSIQTLAVSHSQMRSATLLRLQGEGKAETAQRGRRGRRMPQVFKSDTSATSMTAEIAFTLSMTLQDVLATQFPSHAHRLAVVCPEASAVASKENPNPLDRFVIDRMRHLVRQNEQGLPAGRARPAPVSVEVAQAFEKFSAGFSERGRRAQGDVSATRPALMSILLIEDSDHDLGVAQSFFEQKDRIFRLWRDFLRNCNAQSGSPEETGYDFGSGQLSSVFDFKGAQKLVEALCDTKS